MVTALFAVLAVVFGVLTVAAPASAKNDPDKTPPGQSETFVPPGQAEDFVPPGQQDDGTPGNSAGKVTICHFVHGNGSTGEGYNVITISVNAWENGHSGGVADGGNWVHDERDFVVDGTHPCPPVQPQYCPDGVTPLPAGGVCPTPPPTYCPDGVTPLPADGICPTTTPTTSDATFCVVTGPDAYARMTFTGVTGTDQSTWLSGTTPLSAYTTVDLALCITPEEAAAIDTALAEPATVAPVLPGTVEAAETVAVPAAAKPMPATVAAGGGSTAPTAPVGMLALLALGATALATSTLRLARTTR